MKMLWFIIEISLMAFLHIEIHKSVMCIIISIKDSLYITSTICKIVMLECDKNAHGNTSTQYHVWRMKTKKKMPENDLHNI